MNLSLMAVRVKFATCALLGLTASSVWSADFYGKSLTYLGGGDSRPCVFFTLDGVTEAVPAVPGSGWFVLPKTHPQFKESYALLLSAKLTGKQVNISTSGSVDPCGHAQVVAVGLP